MRWVWRDRFLYLLLLPGFIITFIFFYAPMPALIGAFKNYNMFVGFLKSPWAGWKHFHTIFTIPMFTDGIRHTITLSLLNLLFIFPLPIIFALLLNELKGGLFKRTVTTISYLPYFLATIAVIALAQSFYSRYGTLNDIRVLLFGPLTERILFLTKQWLFVPNVIILQAWQGVGWSSIIYMAAIASIDVQLYEAAMVDGASRLQQCRYITLPGLMPTAILLLILQIGRMFTDNFALVYGLQNPYINYDVIGTIIYKYGIVQGNYSVSLAYSLAQGVVSVALVIFANAFSKKVSSHSIW